MLKYILLSLLILSVFLHSCNSTKFVPDNEYLLSDVKIKNDSRLPTANLESFLRQTTNNKLRLAIYDLSSDSTGVFNKLLRKTGQPPVIYQPSLTEKSSQQIKTQLQNAGYLRAKVDTTLLGKDKKMKVTYNISSGPAYRIHEYEYQISDTIISRIMKIVMERLRLQPKIEKGDYYDLNLLESEINRVTTVLRNTGYANFSKEFVYFKADTTIGNHEVNLFLDIYNVKNNAGFKRYKFNDITIYSGENADLINSSNNNYRRNNQFFRHADTTKYRDITIIRGKDNFLRTSVIARNEYLKKGSYYSDMQLTNTYEAYSNLGAVKQVSIVTTPVPNDSANLMDVDIYLTPGKAHWFKASLEGTNSAGDFGIAPILSYQFQNLFNGSELLTLKLRGGYEFVNRDEKLKEKASNYYEYGGEVGLKFSGFVFPWLPKNFREMPTSSTSFVIGLTNQNRVQYHRRFFNMAVRYNWNALRNTMNNQLDLFDINYVRMPWASESFTNDYLNNPNNPLIKETYKNQLIASTTYTGAYLKTKKYDILSTATLYRFSGQLAGWLPQLITTMARVKRSGKDDAKKILGVSYAQYFKFSGEFAQTINLSDVHSVAYRFGFGIANPYGNSSIIPYEQRFFGGGPNGVRGWQTRRLGPGSYKPEVGKVNFINQVGDISMIFSVENRHKLTSLFSLAEFIDAGNIWTIRNYEGQTGGLFKFNQFYKEIALAYGIGLRMDMQFVLRLDLGVQLHDPSRLGERPWVGPAFKRMALNFAIGYPF